MRHLIDFLTLGSSLLIWTLTISIARSAAFPDHLQRPISLPFQSPHIPQNPHIGKAHEDGRLLARLRDSVIRTVWRVPNDERLKSANPKSPALRISPPSQLLARYGGDLVLRFEIRSAEEAEALADAINVLILDVWEFTTEWVDIRLSKDVVSFSKGTCYYSSTK